MSAGDENNPNGQNVTDTPGTQGQLTRQVLLISAGAEAVHNPGPVNRTLSKSITGLPEQIDESEEARWNMPNVPLTALIPARSSG